MILDTFKYELPSNSKKDAIDLASETKLRENLKETIRKYFISPFLKVLRNFVLKFINLVTDLES